jgi:hypothetical protein
MGALHLSNIKDLRDHPIKWKPIGKDLWQEMDGQQRVFAIRDQANRIVRLAYDFPGVQSQRAPLYEHKGPVLTAVAASLLVLLAVILAPVIRQARRVFPGQRPTPSPQPGTQWLPRTTQVASLVWVILFAALGAVLVALSGSDAMPPTSAWDKYLVLTNFVTALALGLSLFVVFSAIRICRRVKLRHITRVKYAVVAIACLFLSWFSTHWHLLGPVSL